MTDRTQRSAVSKLELQVRYTTALWGWMHDMKYELPPPKKWPPGVHPPGNPSAIATPTMEKLAAQGNQPVEQKEVRFCGWHGKQLGFDLDHHPDCPAF